MVLLWMALSTADAVPLQLTQQGRLLDSSGSAITGLHDLSFRIYDDLSSGLLLWEEVLTVDFQNGYYATVLGGDTVNNPLDESVLSLYPLFIELEVDLSGPLSPRQPILSAPYAQMSNTSENVSGGLVDALEISIGGQLIIDGSGSWVGPTVALNWSEVVGVPFDLLDGDNDTQLSESQVEQFVINDGIDLHSGTTVSGSPILTESSLLEPEWSNIISRPSGLDDGDDDSFAQLNCSEGQSVVLSGGVWTCAILADTLAQLSCQDGEVLIYSQGNWDCTGFNALIDQDSDGVLAWNDCDDNDANNTHNRLNDSDCDGILTADDCNDSDPTSTARPEDNDCDGILTLDDCDDGDSSSFAIINDTDCDNYSNGTDCDPNNPDGYDDNGQSAACAAYSCLDVLNSGYSFGDGTYWIIPNNNSAIEVECDMQTENGGYTYYAIDNGISSRAFTDNNSCNALGMDLVFPRSQAHWDSMLARFDLSYFSTVPGVFKNSDGGNYTDCAMRSGGCGDWQVGDGGRWWLRDTNFSEPSGDYSANCWLSAYSVFPTNDIQFNDANCQYSTTKYICSTNDKP